MTFAQASNAFSRHLKCPSWLQAPEPGDNGGGGSISERISNFVEKVQQEVHGFYFQDERGGPGKDSSDLMATSLLLSVVDQTCSGILRKFFRVVVNLLPLFGPLALYTK